MSACGGKPCERNGPVGFMDAKLAGRDWRFVSEGGWRRGHGKDERGKVVVGSSVKDDTYLETFGEGALIVPGMSFGCALAEWRAIGGAVVGPLLRLGRPERLGERA